jgi:hypothetical protein
LVVVVGIFVGLQISNLNEARKNVLKGESYLNRIAAELEQDIEFFDATLRVNTMGAENGLFLLSTLENEELVRDNPTKFILTIAGLGSTLKINVSNNTFEEIKFSGNLELIDNEDLRNKIADYYDFIEMERNWSHARVLVENTYSSLNVGILRVDQMSQFNPNNEELYSAEEAMVAYGKFKQNKAMINWIPTVVNSKRNNVFFDTSAQRRAKELVVEIRK